MKKIFIVLSCLLSIISANSQEADVLCKEFFDKLFTFNDSAYNHYLAPSVKPKISRLQFQNVANQIITKNGKYLKSKFLCSYLDDKNIEVHFIECQFVNVTLNFKCYLIDKKISGFFIEDNDKPCSNEVEILPGYIDQTKFSTQRYSDLGPQKLIGEEVIPRKRGKDTPLVILIPGSGPTDMNSSIGKTKIFRDIAYGLGSLGIPSVRFNKRTYQHRLDPDSMDIKYEYIEDIEYIINRFKSYRRYSNSPVVLIGHSLGGIAAQFVDSNLYRGLVLLSTPYSRLDSLILNQLSHLANHADSSKRHLYRAERDKLTKQIDYLNYKIKSNSVSTNNPTTDSLPLHISYKYWQSILEFDFTKFLQAKKGTPVLIIHGDRDYQVPPAQHKLYCSHQTENMTCFLGTGLNHFLIEGVGISTPNEYTKPGFLDKKVLKKIFDWLLENF